MPRPARYAVLVVLTAVATSSIAWAARADDDRSASLLLCVVPLACAVLVGLIGPHGTDGWVAAMTFAAVAGVVGPLAYVPLYRHTHELADGLEALAYLLIPFLVVGCLVACAVGLGARAAGRYMWRIASSSTRNP